MLLSQQLYSIEVRVREKIAAEFQRLELTSDSEDSGLEHYMSREEFDVLATHNYDIGVRYNTKFAKKLSKKIVYHLWELSYFFENENIRGMLLSFIEDNRKKFHIDDDLVISTEFESKEYFLLAISDKLWKHPHYFDNLTGNKYTLKDNKTHLTLFEILKALNLHYGISKIARPKKLQRHKGYRDHGSLSDETSRVTRNEWQSDQQNYALIEKELERKKIEEDTKEFIKGFLM